MLNQETALKCKYFSFHILPHLISKKLKIKYLKRKKRLNNPDYCCEQGSKPLEL